MAIHSSILPWRIPWTEEPGEYRPWGLRESDTTERLSTAHSTCSLHMHLCVLNIQVCLMPYTHVCTHTPVADNTLEPQLQLGFTKDKAKETKFIKIGSLLVFCLMLLPQAIWEQFIENHNCALNIAICSRLHLRSDRGGG